jgi:hypothetical protein
MKKVMFKEVGCQAVDLNVFANDVCAYVDLEPSGAAKVFSLIHVECAAPDLNNRYGSITQSAYAWVEEAMNSVRYNMHGFCDMHVAIKAMQEHCDYVGEDLQFWVRSNVNNGDHIKVEVCEREYGTLLVNNG